MRIFRVLLGLMMLSVVVYTLATGVILGLNLLPIFFGDMAAVTWSGQFNLDFTFFLLLTGLWIAWRHQFSPGGLALGFISAVGGMLVVAPYLLFATFQANGHMDIVLLGKQRTVE